MLSSIRRPSPSIIVAVVAVVLAVGGVTYAAIPASDGTLHACYAQTNGLLLGIPHSKGDLRLVDEDEACRNYEQPVSWDAGTAPASIGTKELNIDRLVIPLSGVLAPGQCAKFGPIDLKTTDEVLEPRLAQFVANQGFVTATIATAPTSTEDILLQVCNENTAQGVQLGGTSAMVPIITS